MNYYSPKEIIRNCVDTAVLKSQMRVKQMVPLAILAGAYIACAAEGSTMAVHDLGIAGLSKFIAGIIFSTGLMLVLICGAELFTGNTLLWTGF